MVCGCAGRGRNERNSIDVERNQNYQMRRAWAMRRRRVSHGFDFLVSEQDIAMRSRRRRVSHDLDVPSPSETSQCVRSILHSLLPFRTPRQLARRKNETLIIVCLSSIQLLVCCKGPLCANLAFCPCAKGRKIGSRAGCECR